MNKDTRIDKIREITEGDSFGEEELMWKDDLKLMKVYKIPLKYLIYNKYNGRILSRVKSLETAGEEIDGESEEGKKILERLLWNSKKDRNQTTLDDIVKYGQKRSGIITKDGVVIDGNRRVMLLNRIKEKNYFKAIVLPRTKEEDLLEIEKLETCYQMGEDEKLGYNPIEKYIKTKRLLDQGVEIDEIANWMSEDIGEVKKYERVMEVMDDYLDDLGCKGIYTQLDGREDLFIQVESWKEKFTGCGSSKAFDGYAPTDVDDLVNIAYDYIRVQYEGKAFRFLGKGHRESHLFGNKAIWTTFKDAHFKNIEPIKCSLKEVPPDVAPSELAKALVAWENEFSERAMDLLKDNLKNHEEKLCNQQHKNKPEKLVQKAIDAVAVVKNNKHIQNSLEQVQELNELTTNILKKRSPHMYLKQILELLYSIDIKNDEVSNKKEDLLKTITEISREAYKLQKEIKSLT